MNIPNKANSRLMSQLVGHEFRRLQIAVRGNDLETATKRLSFILNRSKLLSDDQIIELRDKLTEEINQCSNVRHREALSIVLARTTPKSVA